MDKVTLNKSELAFLLLGLTLCLAGNVGFLNQIVETGETPDKDLCNRGIEANGDALDIVKELTDKLGL